MRNAQQETTKRKGLTKTAETVREILKDGSTHIDGTDFRVVDEAAWKRNLHGLRAYINRLPNKRQKLHAFNEGVKVAAAIKVRPPRVASESYERRRARALAGFASRLDERGWQT